jgi:hypothetical protein
VGKTSILTESSSIINLIEVKQENYDKKKKKITTPNAPVN